MLAGTLYIVATPIGNLGDIPHRAAEVLGAVDLIAAEDTRRTGLLLKHLKVNTPMVSFHDPVERKKTPQLIEKLQAGQSVALVSDAGTPGISDPGGYLIPQAIAAGIAVTVVPGPTAVMAALVLSGFPMDRFVFDGYLPVKAGKLRKRLEVLRLEERTVVCYETPHRLLKSLQAIEETLGDIPMAACRELTKKFEEVRREKVSELITHFKSHPPKGEFVLVFRTPQ